MTSDLLTDQEKAFLLLVIRVIVLEEAVEFLHRGILWLLGLRAPFLPGRRVGAAARSSRDLSLAPDGEANVAHTPALQVSDPFAPHLGYGQHVVRGIPSRSRLF